MAFRFPFFKSKKPAEAPASSPPAAPDVPPPAAPAPEIAQKIVPRQGNLAAALRAATATVGGGASPAQSAIFKPKVRVVLKPEASAAPAPPPPAPVMAEVVAAPELSSLPDASATIEIPMAEIHPLLPENVFKPGAAEGASLPDMISLSISEILPQLPKGRVQIPLGTILAAFPSDLIDTSVADSSDLKIKIPLHLIIPRLPESVMSLPKDQVKQQVDASIEVPFSERRVRPAPPQQLAVPRQPVPVEPRKLAAPEISPPINPPEDTEVGGVTTLMPALPVAAPVAKLPSPPNPRPPAPVPAPLSQSKLTPGDATEALTGNIKLPTKPFVLPVSRIIPPAVPAGTPASEVAQAPQVKTPSPQIPPPSIPSLRLPKPPTVAIPIPTIHTTGAPGSSSASAIKPPHSSVVPAPTIKPSAPLPVSAPLKLPSSLSVPTTPPSETKPASEAVSSPTPPAESAPVAPVVPSAITAPNVPKGTSIEDLLAPAAVPVPDTPPAPPLSPLHEILGISDGRELRIPEIAEQIRVRFNLLGVMIATEDGLPMAGSLPSGLDSNAWCGLSHLLFQRFSKNGKATRTEPRRCMLSLGTSWLTIWWQDHGIYLIFVHHLETVTAEFEQRGAVLAREVALQCQQQNRTN